MQKDSAIFVAGHLGLVGSAILENLKNKGYKNFILKSHSELDLSDGAQVLEFFKNYKIDYIFLAAAKVGGILANNAYRADFIYQNLAIQNNIIHNAYKFHVKKLLFLGSTCIYPKNAPQPIKEEYLLSGALEYTNEPYAIAKIAGLKACEAYNLQYGTNFISVMPTNLYGKNDNFNLKNSHVLPAILRKMHLAKLLANGDFSALEADLSRDFGFKNTAELKASLKNLGIEPHKITLWGSGTPKREFLHASDMADACVFVMENVDFSALKCEQEIKNTHINIGTGEEISIKDLAYKIARIVGFDGEISFDKSKPDGTMRKLSDISKLENLGWKHKINLDSGIKSMYEWYKSRF